MTFLFQSRIYRADLGANPKVLYVFGDNERRVGLGGQAAEMRGEPNAIGIATLKAPGVFWTDADDSRQRAVIFADMKPLFVAARMGQTIVFPLDGVGTGLSRLETCAPETFRYLTDMVALLRQEASQDYAVYTPL